MQIGQTLTIFINVCARIFYLTQVNHSTHFLVQKKILNYAKT